MRAWVAVSLALGIVFGGSSIAGAESVKKQRGQQWQAAENRFLALTPFIGPVLNARVGSSAGVSVMLYLPPVA